MIPNHDMVGNVVGMAEGRNLLHELNGTAFESANATHVVAIDDEGGIGLRGECLQGMLAFVDGSLEALGAWGVRC